MFKPLGTELQEQAGSHIPCCRVPYRDLAIGYGAVHGMVLQPFIRMIRYFWVDSSKHTNTIFPFFVFFYSPTISSDNKMSVPGVEEMKQSECCFLGQYLILVHDSRK